MISESIVSSVMITGFVAVMMMLVDYLNVLSNGGWQESVRNHLGMQHLICSFLGATPGCLGSFAVVSLYVHKVVSYGALVTTMIASSGDAAFIMLATFPKTALQLFLILFLIAIPVGALVDLVWKKGSVKGKSSPHAELELHDQDQFDCSCFAGRDILKQWRRCSFERGTVATLLIMFLLGVFLGKIGPGVWNWMRATLVVTSSIGLAIVATAPDHFLQEHIWKHIVKKHILRVFLWILGTLLFMNLLLQYVDIRQLIDESNMALLLILLTAVLIGLIPDSGPHLIFVTLFAQGQVPFSILLASSIVQDGHGMLPVLAHSTRTFVSVKLINSAVGLAFGLLGYFMGW